MSRIYELKINDGITYMSDFNEVIRIINDELNEYFSNKQCFKDRMPFYLGVYEFSLYEDEKMTDDKLTVLNKIRLLLNEIGTTNKIDFIDKDYTIECCDEDYNLFAEIRNNINEIKLSLIDFSDGTLITNMFNMNPNMELGYTYYFDSWEMVTIRMRDEKLNLGDVIRLSILVKVIEKD